MADWLASNTTYFPLIDQEYLGQTLRYPDRIDTAWRTIHLPDAWTPCCFFMDEEQFAQRFNFYPYPEMCIRDSDNIDQLKKILIELLSIQINTDSGERMYDIANIVKG